MSKSLGTGIDPLDLIEGGPRPPVFAAGSEEPGEFPAYGADAVRWGLLAMSSGQDVKFSEEKIAQGQQLTNKLWNAARLILLGVGPDARAAARRRPPRTAGSSRVWQRAKTEVSATDRALRLLTCGAGAVRVRLRRAVRLVPRARQAAPARGRARARVDASARADRDRRARAPADPVRDRGDLLAHPGRRRAARRRVSSTGPWRGRRAFRAADRRRDRRRPGAADVARRRRGQGRRGRAGKAARVRLRRDRRPRRPARAARAQRTPRSSAETVATVPIPGGTVEVLASEQLDLEGAQRRLAQRRSKLQRRDRARRAQAGQPKALPPRHRRTWSRPSAKSLRRLRGELEAL